MTSTLTVIALVTRVKVTSHITNGYALYREKVSNVNHEFSFKQFSNSHHEYNEVLKEGDLVLFGGKFTVDEEKLLLIVEMACIIEPKLGQKGESLKWDPTQIPSTKPFVHVTTSASGPLTSSDDMNFIKTKSLLYSAFHPAARNVNFEIGYSKDSKWLEHLADKWNEFANFFVTGFLEAIYLTNGEPITQIDAKCIDYDTKFRNPNTSATSPKRSNAFAQRRSQALENSPTTAISPSTTSISIMKDTQEKSGQVIISKSIEKQTTEQSTSSRQTRQTRKRQTSDLSNVKNEPDQSEDDPDQFKDEPDQMPPSTPTHKTRKRQLSDLCDEDESEQPNDKKGSNGRGR